MEGPAAVIRSPRACPSCTVPEPGLGYNRYDAHAGHEAPNTRDTYFLDCDLKRRSVRSIETLSSVMQPAALMDSFEPTRGPRLFLVVSLMSRPFVGSQPNPSSGHAPLI